MPLISIITPSFNSAAFIVRTIESIQQQDYPCLEHLVIDGGSTDGTIEILHRYPQVQWVSEPDNGQSDALNKGFKRARGEIIGWLNADDTYNPGAVRAAITYFQQHPEVAVAYSHCNVIDEKDQVLYCLKASPFDLAHDLLEHRLPQPAAFIRAEALAAVGYLDETLHYVMDRDLFMRLGARYRLAAVNAVWANFRECQGTKTMSHPERFWLEVIRVFDRFFQMPDLPSEVLCVKAQAYARAYWMAGITHFTDAESQKVGAAYCQQALETFPLLDQDLKFVSARVTYQAVNKPSVSESEMYVRAIFDALSSTSPAARRRAFRYVWAEVCAAIVLMCPGLSPQERWNHWKTAVHYDPIWLKNRGLWSKAIHAFWVSLRRGDS